MNNRTLLKYHSVLGLFAGLLLVLMGLTGAILIFNEDIDAACFQKYEVSDTSNVMSLDKALALVQREFPMWDTRIVHFKKGETILFNLRRPEERRFVFVHPETGTLLGNIDANTTFSKWVLKLHYSLHAGLVGRIVVLITGILFFLSLLTGILLYRKVIVKTLLFKIKVKRSHKRNFYSALHRYVGVWALVMNLVLVITGLFLAYKVVQSGLQQPKEPTTPLLQFSLDNALEKVQKELPDFSPTYIRLPNNNKADLIFNGVFENDPFYFSEYYNKIVLDAKSGAIKEIVRVTDTSLGNQLNSMVSPLHFGQYGGFWIKLLYCLAALSGPFLSISGYIIWRSKK
ncbi:PepSY-associated TM helix domain-containing protein [Flavobacterium chuncheonense]|uniref:PepSY-associated TM helix domain-containing protein n=1 Tax=Flavobacterium chuncheonense TaxID=2026653 RepID=A0ABW5YPP0_9FLAO